MIGPRRDRDWFDRPEAVFLWIAAGCVAFAAGCVVLWAVLL